MSVCWTEIREANRVEDDVLEADSATRRLTRRAGELQCRAGHWSCRASPGWFDKAGGLLYRTSSRGVRSQSLGLAARCDGEEHRAIRGRGMVTSCEEGLGRGSVASHCRWRGDHG